jgi:hypothetical protein
MSVMKDVMNKTKRENITGVNVESPSKYSYIVKKRRESNRSSVSDSKKSGRLTPEHVFDGLYGNPLKDQ